MNSQLRIAQLLRLGPTEGDCKWSKREIRELERQVLRGVADEASLKIAFDSLSKVVARYCWFAKAALPFPRSIHRTQYEVNPFSADIVASEQLIVSATSLLGRAANDLTSKQPTERPRGLIGLIVLSAVVNLHLMHTSMHSALIEALANPDRFFVKRKRKLHAIILSLAYQGQPDSETRLYFPDPFIRSLISQLREGDVHDVFRTGLDSTLSVSARHESISSSLDEFVGDLSTAYSGDGFTLTAVTDAARALCYIRMPAAIAAHRCRKIISHAPKRHALERILNWNVNSHFVVPPASKSQWTREALKEDDRHSDKEISDTAQVEPEWLIRLRKTFRLAVQDTMIEDLNSYWKSIPQPGSRIAEFALARLLEGNSPGLVKRQTLIVARRLGCRLLPDDPAALDVPTFENLCRDALKDDWHDDSSDNTLGLVRKNKVNTVKALKSFHGFLNKRAEGKLKLSKEFGPVLQTTGLLDVNANFITVDEYLHLLDHVADVPGGISNDYLLESIQLIIVLSFRCGLRRNEALYLRTDDFDRSNHLHVRSYDERKVKTTNSNRSLPVEALLSDKELMMLRKQILNRRGAHKSGTHILLFSEKDDASKVLNEESLFDRIHVMMRAALGDRTLRDHHLRHSFATLLFAKLSPKTDPFLKLYLRNHRRL